jgi:hypothetical protein
MLVSKAEVNWADIKKILPHVNLQILLDCDLFPSLVYFIRPFLYKDVASTTGHKASKGIVIGE